MYNVESAYPEKVDDLIFFSDISYSNKEVEQRHKELMNQGRYTEASEYLKTQNRVTPYNADLFNLMANRIKAIQKELFKRKENQVMMINQDEPSVSSDTHWITYID